MSHLTTDDESSPPQHRTHLWSHFLSVSPCSPTGSKPDSSPRMSRMKPPFLQAKMENATGAPRSPKQEGKGRCLGWTGPAQLLLIGIKCQTL